MGSKILFNQDFEGVTSGLRGHTSERKLGRSSPAWGSDVPGYLNYSHSVANKTTSMPSNAYAWECMRAQKSAWQWLTHALSTAARLFVLPFFAFVFDLVIVGLKWRVYADNTHYLFQDARDEKGDHILFTGVSLHHSGLRNRFVVMIVFISIRDGIIHYIAMPLRRT